MWTQPTVLTNPVPEAGEATPARLGLPPGRLPVVRLGLTLVPERDLALPEFAGGLLRSVWGAALRRGHCVTGHSECPACPLWRSCGYPALFATPPRATQLVNRVAQVPHPYVMEPPPLGRTHWRRGEALRLHMVLVGRAALAQLPAVLRAWQQAGRQGLGQARIPAWLAQAELLPPGGVPGVAPAAPALPVFEAQSAADAGRVLGDASTWAAWGLDWAQWPAWPAQAQGLAVHLLTPLRVQNNGRVLGPQELSPRKLVSDVLRRLSLMLELHLNVQTLPFDVHALLNLAQGLEDDRTGLYWKDMRRFSAHQGQEAPLSGVMGVWWLRGQGLAPLWPYLQWATWLHAGKSTTQGLGALALQPGPG